MRSYPAMHQRLVRRLSRRGLAVEFRRDSPGQLNPLTERFTGAASQVVAGYAVERPGEAQEYEKLELTKQDPVTLTFTPVTYGEEVGVGWWVTWAGKRRTVRASTPVRPDGVVLAVKLVLA